MSAAESRHERDARVAAMDATAMAFAEEEEEDRLLDEGGLEEEGEKGYGPGSEEEDMYIAQIDGRGTYNRPLHIQNG